MNVPPLVWIDFENAPHVWVLSRMIQRLAQHGYATLLTARDVSYTLALCRHLGYDVHVVGAAGVPRTNAGKAIRLATRTLQLVAHVAGSRHRIALALSHGSRSQILAARLLGLKIISMDDYEHSNQSVVRFVDFLLVPAVIPKDHWGPYAGKIVHYPGLKEDLYLSHSARKLRCPELETGRVNVLFRPEGPKTHYRAAVSEVLQSAILDYLGQKENILLVLLPRDAVQAQELAAHCSSSGLAFWIPESVASGPGLVSSMDLVIGGGGTMTREAAVLGVPAYSFFGGRWGAVDRYLEATGRLVRIAKPSDVEKIAVEHRKHHDTLDVTDRGLEFVAQFILDALKEPA